MMMKRHVLRSWSVVTICVACHFIKLADWNHLSINRLELHRLTLIFFSVTRSIVCTSFLWNNISLFHWLHPVISLHHRCDWRFGCSAYSIYWNNNFQAKLSAMSPNLSRNASFINVACVYALADLNLSWQKNVVKYCPILTFHKPEELWCLYHQFLDSGKIKCLPTWTCPFFSFSLYYLHFRKCHVLSTRTGYKLSNTSIQNPRAI